MAYKNCAAQIAANIAQDCNRPLVGGYTGRAVIIPISDWARAEVVTDANNPRKIMSIVLPPDGSVMAYTIDNVFAAPFTGSNTTGNTDTGRNGYLKTIAVRVPMRGADVSMKVIEPLVKDADGFVVIAEKRDKVGDGSYEVIGYQNAMRGDIASVTRDENANGGDWIVNLTTIEKWAEVTLVGAAETYESAKKEFEVLFGFDINIIRFVFDERSDTISLAANGIVWIDTIKAGRLERLKLTSLNPVNYTQILLDSDEGTEVVVYGEVIKFNAESTIHNLDVSNCKTLKTLVCTDCQGITSLDVSNNIALTQLECNYCANLTSLDVSKNEELTELYCTGTGITSLNLSNNKKLKTLFCARTELTSLDVSKNSALTELNCEGNTGLMLLDIQRTTMIEDLFLNNGLPNLTTLQVAGTSESAYSALDEWFGEGGGAPTRGMIYVDANTPQSVITAAEAKEWEVIYVS
jgi:hypothetical protein